MAHLTLDLLGPVRASLDGDEVTDLPTTKVRALLAYVAVESDRPHTRSRLGELLWPERPEGVARRNLRHALSSLRLALGDRAPNPAGKALPPFLLVSRETIQFNVESDHCIDVAAFQAGLHLGQEGESRISHMERAIALYRGPFLEGFSVADSPEFEDWLILWRERLARQAVAALRQLAGHHGDRGQHERACDHARRLVELDALDEAGHRQLMRSLAAHGQRNAALIQYETCRRLLREELGVEPAPATTELYERIRDGAMGRASTSRPSGLPTPLLRLVGREEELAEIGDRLADPSCRLLTLVGPGGMGKTRLAIEAAGRAAGAFPDGVSFISLAALRSASGVVPAMAQALGFYFQNDDSPLDQLLGYLRGRCILLVVDNVEHLPDCAGLLARILEASPGVIMLATSRTRLDVLGEQLYPVAGMRYPAPPAALGPDTALDHDAVVLFLDSSRRARPGYEPTQEDLQHAIKICRLVDGMPLGILLAASWMGMLSAGEISAELSPEAGGPAIDFLERDWPGMPKRQRSIRATLDYSWNLLNARERKALAALSIFCGGFTKEAAQTVAGASLRDLMMLVDRSLLGRTDAGRFEIHELPRQYAQEKLEENSTKADAVRDQHAAFYSQALDRWETALKSADEMAALHEMDVELANLRAAWDWAVQRRQVSWLGRGAYSLGRFLDRRVLQEEGEAMFGTATSMLSMAEPDLASRLSAQEGQPDATMVARQHKTQALLTAWRGVFAGRLGHDATSLHLLEEALALLDAPPLDQNDTRRERAFVMGQMGSPERLSEIGFQAAREWTERALALYRALGDRWGVAEILHTRSWIAIGQQQYAEARCLLEEALDIRRALGAPTAIAASLRSLGHVAAYQGQLEEAEKLQQECYTLSRATGARALIADSLAYLGRTLHYLGRFSEACSMLGEAVSVQRDLGRSLRESTQLSLLGQSEMHLGRYAQARADAERALDLSRDRDSQGNRPSICDLLADVALAEGGYAAAQKWYEASAEQSGQRYGQGTPNMDSLGLAVAFHRLGKRAEARQYLCRALGSVVEMRRLWPMVHIVCFSALLVEQDDPAQALELYATASQLPFVANSRWFAEVCGKCITSAAGTLPPDVVAAAKERGRARDLWSTAEALLVELGD